MSFNHKGSNNCIPSQTWSPFLTFLQRESCVVSALCNTVVIFCIVWNNPIYFIMQQEHNILYDIAYGFELVGLSMQMLYIRIRCRARSTIERGIACPRVASPSCTSINRSPHWCAQRRRRLCKLDTLLSTSSFCQSMHHRLKLEPHSSRLRCTTR